MASRLMISLKKAVDKGVGPWSLTTMDCRRGGSSEDETLDFVPWGFDTSHEISGAVAPPNEEVIELDSVPRSPWDRGSQQQC